MARAVENMGKSSKHAALAHEKQRPQALWQKLDRAGERPGSRP